MEEYGVTQEQILASLAYFSELLNNEIIYLSDHHF
jgi:hypothetical protein